MKFEFPSLITPPHEGDTIPSTDEKDASVLTLTERIRRIPS